MASTRAGTDRLLPVAVTAATAVALAGLVLAAATSRSLGTSFLAAMTGVSGTSEPVSTEVDWGRAVPGLVAALGLLAVALIAYLVVTEPRDRRTLMSYPGAVAAVGMAVMVAVVQPDLGGWLAGPIMAALGGLLWALDRSTPLLLAAAGGVLVFAGKVFQEVLGAAGPGSHGPLVRALLLWAVIAALSALVWRLPSGRDVVVATLGGVGFLASSVLMIAVLITVASATVFPGVEPARPDLDMWVVMLSGLAAAAAYAWCHLRTGLAAYRLLVLGGVAQALVLGAAAIARDGTMLWLTLFTVVGLLGLAAALGAAVRPSQR